MTKEVYVLDSCALIAFFRQEEGASIVAKIFEGAAEHDFLVYIHKATIAEVYYDTLRFAGKDEAERILKVLASLPVLPLSIFNNNFIKSIGYFKVNHKVSFADCFVLASAFIKKATIITSDHHEFGSIEKLGILSFN